MLNMQWADNVAYCLFNKNFNELTMCRAILFLFLIEDEMCARHHNAHQTQRLNHNFKWEVWCHPRIALICLLVITAFYHKCRSTCEEHGSLQRMKSRQMLDK
ncbi:hypothetical protein AVEN_90964-1 [Araneus ventricosus]|uniref:Uncharacterized protein n=1 Tax=Araneus ventricosus TaxID=182803 RepID=A0A4Y2SZF4_ARAVE|nr:hypothetical protein AVEN_189019-1 [Araneus ventricosus]GBN93160.1 hypothetical protein AVEN_90964-1 [Araneus ventricosus]